MMRVIFAFLCFVCALTVNAQDCKMCGVWNGSFKDVFPTGLEYRVDVEFKIEGNKKFEYKFKAKGYGIGDSGNSNDVTFVDDACNDHFIKYYEVGEDDDWAGEKFKGKRIGTCKIHSYNTLELKEDGSAVILKRLGRDYFYFDNQGNYIGKEWKDGPDDTFICILHQLED